MYTQWYLLRVSLKPLHWFMGSFAKSTDKQKHRHGHQMIAFCLWGQLVVKHYQGLSMQLHWGRGWWGRQCPDPGPPWNRHLDRHRDSPPRCVGAPPGRGSGLGWWTWSGLDYSGNVPQSSAGSRQLGQETETLCQVMVRLLYVVVLFVFTI